MKKLLLIFIFLFFLVNVSAQVIFPSPVPITIRDSVSQNQYNVLALGYDQHIGNAVESDRGLNAFEGGTNLIFSKFSVSTVQYSDFNIVSGSNTDIVEFISDNFEVLTPSGWVSGNGYTLAVIMSANSPNLGNENGFGNPTYAASGGSTVYVPHTNMYGMTVPSDRLYGAPRILTSATTLPPFVTGNGYFLNNYFESADLEDNLLAFSTNYPINPSGYIYSLGACPVLSYPSYNAFVPGACYSMNQYIYYLDIGSVNFANEGTLIPIQGSPSTPFQNAPGLYENNPSVSKIPSGGANNYLIARDTNMLNIGTNIFDVVLYDVTSASDTLTIPEISMSNPLNQIMPSFEYPFIAFLEIPQGNYPYFNIQPFMINGDLHLYNLNSGSRTTVPIDTGVTYAKIAYDTNSGVGVLAYLTSTNTVPSYTLKYVLLNSNGVVGSPVTISVPSGMTFQNNNFIEVTSNNGNPFVYYALTPTTGSFTLSFYRHNVNTGQNNLILYDPNLVYQEIGFDEPFTVSGDNNYLSVRTQPIQGGYPTSQLYNIDSSKCTNVPCVTYQLGRFGRWAVSGYESVRGIDELIRLDNNNPTGNYVAVFSTEFRLSPHAMLDINNL